MVACYILKIVCLYVKNQDRDYFSSYFSFGCKTKSLKEEAKVGQSVRRHSGLYKKAFPFNNSVCAQNSFKYYSTVYECDWQWRSVPISEWQTGAESPKIAPSHTPQSDYHQPTLSSTTVTVRTVHGHRTA